MNSRYGILLCALSTVLSVSCGAGGNQATVDESNGDTTIQASQIEQSIGDPFKLKNVMINVEYVFPDGENVRGFKMDAAALSKFKPENIDEFYAMGDTYYVTDTISTSKSGSVYLIVKYDPNETSGWLVIYDPGMKVMDMIEVYYENAEGNFYLSSSILDNIVTTSGENITPEENPVSAFRIVDGPRWQIIEH